MTQEPPANRRLGPYLLEEELGRGAMGVVYRGRDTRIDRPVAIKLILAESPAQADRFELEARAAARLSHKNLVAVHDLARAGGQLFLVSELVQGKSLKDVLREEGPLPAERAVRILIQLCAGVEHAHQAGVVHRDIKPENVLLAAGEVPRLTDFGVARLDHSRLTQTGQMIGTPSYMSPEQASGDKASVGPQSDVYSLGASLYDLLCGRPPFAEGAPLSTITALLTKAPPPPSGFAPVPPALEAIVLGALSKDPAQRPPSAAALGAALEGWLAGESAPPSRAPLYRGLAAAGLATVVAAGLLALALTRTSALPATPGATPLPTDPGDERTPAERLREARSLWAGTPRLDPAEALRLITPLIAASDEACELAGELLAAGQGDLEGRRAAYAALEQAPRPSAQRAWLRGRCADPRAEPAEVAPLAAELAAASEGASLRWLGALHERRQEWRLAAAAYAKAKGDPLASVALGRLEATRLKQREQGMGRLKRLADEGSPDAVVTLAQAAHRWSRDERMEEAMLLYARVPEHPQSLVGQALLLAKGEQAKARELMERAAELGEVEAWVWLGRRDLRSPDPKTQARGVALLARATSRGARDARNLWASAIAKGLGGARPQVGRALAEFHRARDLGDAEAWQDLILFLYRLERPQEGLAEARALRDAEGVDAERKQVLLGATGIVLLNDPDPALRDRFEVNAEPFLRLAADAGSGLAAQFLAIEYERRDRIPEALERFEQTEKFGMGVDLAKRCAKRVIEERLPRARKISAIELNARALRLSVEDRRAVGAAAAWLARRQANRGAVRRWGQLADACRVGDLASEEDEE